VVPNAFVYWYGFGSDHSIVGSGHNHLLRIGPFLTWFIVELKLKAAVVGNRFMNGEAGGAWLSQAIGVAERLEGEALSVRSAFGRAW
jgi:hypothetical protein